MKIKSQGALNLKRDKFLWPIIGLKFEEETSEVLRLEHGSVWY